MRLELRTLGGLEMIAPGAEMEAAGLQPKRLALLAYLLAARPTGFVRRDMLLALFWPDLPARRARLALRQALHQLRLLALPDHPIRVLGRGAVAADHDCVSCDAYAFEVECHEGAAEAALARYRGEFLDGVHVAGVSAEFEEWLTDRRRHYRELAVCAAWRVAGDADRAGHPDDAIAAAERALQLAPDDEPGLRRLMLLLEARGNRATALRHYDRFARRLATDLFAAPSPLTRQVAERLRVEGPLATQR